MLRVGICQYWPFVGAQVGGYWLGRVAADACRRQLSQRRGRGRYLLNGSLSCTTQAYRVTSFKACFSLWFTGGLEKLRLISVVIEASLDDTSMPHY